MEVKYQCNNCKKEFEIPGEYETITLTNYQPPIQQQGTVIPVTSLIASTTIIRKSICPYCHQLDFHEIKEG
jgi:hypothetical protein